jgi:hypothetical protein
MPTEIDRLNEEIMKLQKDRDRLTAGIDMIQARVKEIQNSEDPSHQPGYIVRNNSTIIPNVDAWNEAIRVMLALRTIVERGELMPPEDLWKKPGYIIVCDGYVTDIFQVNNETRIFPTLSPIFTSREWAQAKVDKLGKDGIINAYRTLMFAADNWPQSRKVERHPYETSASKETSTE